MSQIGTDSQPLRVAIIGAGPTGFYAAGQLFKQKNIHVEVDMYDRLPTPFGLVRAGVAPDHPKIKSVTKLFERTAENPAFRFFGYVEIGKDIQVSDLRKYYHQIIYTIGAQSDKNLRIPGINLRNSHSATEFVAWYNGHPDFRDCHFDLSQESVAVIGIGNVAVDVARILCRTTEELASTDIADHALEALHNSNVKEVYMLGRRGPAQGAFTPPELKELGEMADADIIVLPQEAELDELSKAAMVDADRGTMRKVEIVKSYAKRKPEGKSRKLTLRFLVSPVELIGDESGRVKTVRLVKNELYATEVGTMRPRPIDIYEEIPVGLVFRSIGYRGIPIPGVPFNDDWGVILNENGRVVDPEDKEPVLGEYTAGWIKRGPTGVIGTNKPDAIETVEKMMEDFSNGKILQPDFPQANQVRSFVQSKQPDYFSYEDWLVLDEIERTKGKAQQRPRVKFTRIKDMIEARAS